MQHVHGVIGKLLTKGIMKFQFAHDLLLEYLQEATPVEIQVRWNSHEGHFYVGVTLE